MLAAAPAHSGRPLDLFVLALTLATAQQATPATLADHFNETLRQALSVLNNPATLNADISNEAVQLALEMNADPQMRTSLEKLTSYDQVTPQVASEILKEMSAPLEA